jgi:hypothetical protein
MNARLQQRRAEIAAVENSEKLANLSRDDVPEFLRGARKEARERLMRDAVGVYGPRPSSRSEAQVWDARLLEDFRCFDRERPGVLARDGITLPPLPVAAPPPRAPAPPRAVAEAPATTSSATRPAPPTAPAPRATARPSSTTSKPSNDRAPAPKEKHRSTKEIAKDDVLAACAAAELKEGPRMVLLVLFFFTDSTGAAWPTEEQVADLAGMSASTVRANLALLHRAGLVWTITPAPSERGKVAAQVTYTDEKGRAKRLPRGRRLRYVMPVTPAHVRERIANDPRSYGLGAARGVRASGDD